MSLIIWGCLAAAVLVGPFPIRLTAGERISSFLIKQKFSHNLVMFGSSGLGGTISNVCGTVSSMLSGLKTRSLGFNTLGTT